MDKYLKFIIRSLILITLVCIALAYSSVLIFAALVFVGIDHWFFVAAGYYLYKAAVILSAISAVAVLACRRYWRGLIYITLILILSVPFIYSDYQCKKIVKRRIEAKKKYSGEYNLRLLGKELLKYTETNGSLPPAERWCDCLMEFNGELIRENFRHPQAPPESVCNFALNRNLAGLDPKDISDKTVLLFEADGPWNLNGTANVLRPRFNNEQDLFMLYLNGTVRSYWFEEGKIREFKSYFGQVKMYYESPRWNP